MGSYAFGILVRFNQCHDGIPHAQLNLARADSPFTGASHPGCFLLTHSRPPSHYPDSGILCMVGQLSKIIGSIHCAHAARIVCAFFWGGIVLCVCRTGVVEVLSDWSSNGLLWLFCWVCVGLMSRPNRAGPALYEHRPDILDCH
jgi:hypothetical protein